MDGERCHCHWDTFSLISGCYCPRWCGERLHNKKSSNLLYFFRFHCRINDETRWVVRKISLLLSKLFLVFTIFFIIHFTVFFCSGFRSELTTFLLLNVFSGSFSPLIALSTRFKVFLKFSGLIRSKEFFPSFLCWIEFSEFSVLFLCYFSFILLLQWKSEHTRISQLYDFRPTNRNNWDWDGKLETLTHRARHGTHSRERNERKFLFDYSIQAAGAGALTPTWGKNMMILRWKVEKSPLCTRKSSTCDDDDDDFHVSFRRFPLALIREVFQWRCCSHLFVVVTSLVLAVFFSLSTCRGINSKYFLRLIHFKTRLIFSLYFLFWYTLFFLLSPRCLSLLRTLAQPQHHPRTRQSRRKKTREKEKFKDDRLSMGKFMNIFNLRQAVSFHQMNQLHIHDDESYSRDAK